MRKVFSAIFAVLAVEVAAACILLSFLNLNAKPLLLEEPEAARQQATALMDALCAGEYEAVSQVLWGQPELGMDRAPEEEVGKLFFAAYQDSLEYEVLKTCYATDDGVALDVRVTCLDLEHITGDLRQRSQALLEQRVAEAADIAEVYDESGEYREDFVMDVLYQAAQQSLTEQGKTVTRELTLDCVYQDGRWWILPGDLLLEIISGGME